jgi:hypothetical protein
MKTTSTQRMQKLRDEARSKGFVRLPELWCRAEHKTLIKAYAKKLRDEK